MLLLLCRLAMNTRYNYFAVRCTELVMTEFYFVHIAACIFYFLAVSYPTGNNWVSTLTLGSQSYENNKEHDIGELYCVSLYWAVATMATVGELLILERYKLQWCCCYACRTACLCVLHFGIQYPIAAPCLKLSRANTVFRRLWRHPPSKFQRDGVRHHLHRL